MTPQEFCYWLQGYFELGGGEVLTKEQVVNIKEHLKLVFNKVTPQLQTKVDDYLYFPPLCSTEVSTSC